MIPPPPRSTLFPYTPLFRSSYNYLVNGTSVTKGTGDSQTLVKLGFASIVAGSVKNTSDLQSPHQKKFLLLLDIKKLFYFCTDKHQIRPPSSPLPLLKLTQFT